METYWDAFNRKYQGACCGKSLTQILEAFWYYCNNNEDRTRKILGYKDKIKATGGAE